MATDHPLSPTEFFNKINRGFCGFHYRDPRNNGMTSYAVRVESRDSDPIRKYILEHRKQRTIIDIRDDKTAYDWFNNGMYQSELANRRGVQDISSKNRVFFRPVTCLVRGGGAGSVSTLCAVSHVFTKTTYYLTSELSIVCDIVAASERPIGQAIPDRSMVSVLLRDGVISKLKTDSTIYTLLRVCGFMWSRPMAKALITLFMADQNVRRGFDDSGKHFRDLTSRKMAQTAYEEALYNVMYGVTSRG